MKTISKVLLQFTLACIAVLSTAVFSFAEIGFHAKLDTPPLFITHYEEVEDKISVAIYPKTYPILSRWLKYKPRPKESNFAENSIRFETEYFNIKRDKYFLIPLSVDAEKYSQYRIRKSLQKKLRENFSRSISKDPTKKKGSGLGVQVALPKRLEKIFGEGSAGLKISGRRRISFAGRSNWSDEATSGINQSKFPALVMDQVSQFNITGTIGSKITVKVSQDSQTDIPLANRIQIRYRGDEDDILKAIEAGNTTLSLPNTKFVGYSSRIRGLFGLKTEAQVGNLRLTAIASQEKGSSETTSITAGGEESVEYIRDYEYVERRIFDLVLPFDSLKPTERVTVLDMYESVPSYNSIEDQIVANFYVDPDSTARFASEAVKGNDTKIKAIPSTKYRFYHDSKRNVPYVVFNSPQSRNNHIGYYMEVEDENGAVRTFGDLGDTLETPIDSVMVIDSITNDTTYDVTYKYSLLYKLKLLIRAEPLPAPTDQTWKLMWRNCYNVPKGALIEDIKFKVLKGLEGNEKSTNSVPYQIEGSKNIDYLEILGLDLKNTNTGKDTPDGIVDDDPLIYRSDWGLVIFPSRTPFNDTITYQYGNTELPGLDKKVPELYNYTSWTEKTERSEYFIQKVTTTRGSIIRLNRANIIEGSERITVNGEILKKGIDYDIQYDFGQVTLRSEKATDPNAQIKVDFEYAPFFAVQKKSLLGLRAEYEWSKDLKFGSTFLYKSDKAQERKPKVGQETARTVIFDADLSLKLYPEFLTSMVDALPFIETESKSNLTISAEIAQSHPNPNVNEVAYVDDFATALDNISLGTFRTVWKQTSLPAQLDASEYVQAKMLWHRPINQTPITDIYNRDTQAGSGTMRTFRMIFRPQNQVVDTAVAEDSSLTITTTPTKSWGGIMRYFGSPLQENRVKLFEVRMRATSGKIHFDFGAINEDLNNNDNADTEDRDNSNDIDIEGTEDTGLDGLMDKDEVPEGEYDPSVNPDPNGDNWYSFFDGKGKCPLPEGCDAIDADDYNNPRYYDFLNGTEGNISDGGSSRLPDKEKYSPGFTTNNAYFSYVLDLDNYPDSFLVKDSKRYPENDLNQLPWVTYRIPIKDPDAIDQIITSEGGIQPEWNKITHVRIWMEGDELSTKWDTVEVADWYFVQPNWRDSVIFSPLSDMKSDFVIASIGDDIDTNFYPPPSVEAYKDPTTNVIEVQKALQLTFENLNQQDTCIATKNLLSIDQYSGYRRIEMFVHGDENIVTNTDIDKIRFFFRLGRDDKNYYEYFTNIKPGWDQSNHVNIDFNELTALKDSALKVLKKGEVLNVENDKYRITGNPNINEIKFLAVGVLNEDTVNSISGNIWIDELRVTDVRKDVGTAGRISANGNMADLISYNFSLQSKDPFFRGLSSATRGGSQNNLGSGRHETTMSSSMTFNLHKLLPQSWSASIPVTLSYNKSVQTPLLRNNSDIILAEETRIEEQRVSESKSFSISAKFKKKTKNPLFSVLLNRLNSRMSYRQTNLKSVNFSYNYGEVLDLKADYNLNIKKIPKIPIFFFLKSIPILKKASDSKLSLYPDSWTMNGSFNRSISIRDAVNSTRRTDLKRNFTGSMKISFKFFNKLVSSYSYNTRRDLTNLELINFKFNRKDFKLGLETYYGQKFTASYDPQLLKFFTTSFSYKSSYSDDLERTNLTRRSALSRNMSVGGTFDHQALLGGKSTSSSGRSFKGRRGGRKKNVIEEENKKKKKFYEPVLTGVRKLTGWISPFKYSYNTNFTNSLPGLVKRPNYRYLFGFTDDANVETLEDTRIQKSGNGESYDISSGFTFLGGLVTTVKFRRSISRDLVKQGKRFENISENWPDLGIRITKFRNLPLIQSYVNKFIDIFSPRTGFSRSVKESRDRDGNFTVTKSTSTGFNPLLQINFKLFRSLSLTSSVTRSITESETHSPVDGVLQSTSTTSKQTFALTTKYSFTSQNGISIPIFGRLKFRSTVDLSMNVKFNSSKTENHVVIGNLNNVTNDESSISFNPVIAYTFSRQIKGGITMRWQDVKGRRNNHTREVQLWTEISF